MNKVCGWCKKELAENEYFVLLFNASEIICDHQSIPTLPSNITFQDGGDIRFVIIENEDLKLSNAPVILENTWEIKE